MPAADALDSREESMESIRGDLRHPAHRSPLAVYTQEMTVRNRSTQRPAVKEWDSMKDPYGRSIMSGARFLVDGQFLVVLPVEWYAGTSLILS